MKLQELAPYLPYSIKMLYSDGGGEYYVDTLEGIYNGVPMTGGEDAEGYKLILRPLSDLTKEITVDGYNEGEAFMPFDKLIVECQTDAERDYLHYIDENARIGAKIKYAPYTLMRLLFQWHFDVFGLIEKGEAVDINTLQ